MRCRLVCLVLCLGCVPLHAQKPELLEVTKISERAPHSAFTDLIRFKGRWFCVFREGKGHVSPDGAVRVLSSADGKAWESAALLTSKTADLRDPKITLTPDGRLQLSAAAALHDRSKHSHQTLTWFSADGKDWGEPAEVGERDFWLWRITWHGKAAYGVGYQTGKEPEKEARLYASKDGKAFGVHVKPFHSVGHPNEAALVFLPNDTCLCLLRRDGKPNTALLGTARPPYRDWKWRDTGVRVGGPNMIRLPDGRLIAVVRLYDKKVRTAVCEVDTANAKLTELLALPSGGDTSYAGLAWHDGLLWVSYYASHEGKTSIYLAKVRFPAAGAALDVGGRRELFADTHLIDSMTGVALRAERPRDEGVVLRLDKPWEGPFCGYATVLRDGERYRLYYRGLPSARADGSTAEVTCLAESKDGKVWTKPELGLFEVGGSKANNVVLAGLAPYSHNFCPMLDTRPGVPADQRYKALAGIAKTGLAAFASADGLRWRKLADRVITKGAFDSQNVPFWSEAEGCYLCYFRVFVNKHRQIARTTSKDFLSWTEPVVMTHDTDPRMTRDARVGIMRHDAPLEHLYTNQTHPYFRAPHLYVGLAARFMPGRQVLDAEQAKAIGVHPSYFRDCSDAVLLTSRGGSRYDRTFLEGYLTPGIGPENWVSRTNYPALGIVPTGPAEMSFYVNQNYGQPTAHIRRYSLRTDGLAALEAGYRGGEVVTRPLTFTGRQLVLNFATSAAGGIRVEILGADGSPIPGFSLADSMETIGNEIERAVRWKGGSDVSTLAGKPIRLRFVMKDARLYALRFV